MDVRPRDGVGDRMSEGFSWSWVGPQTLERYYGGCIERVRIVDDKIISSFSWSNTPGLSYKMDPPLDAVLMLLGKREESLVTQRMLNDTAHLPGGYYVTDNVTVGDIRATQVTK